MNVPKERLIIVKVQTPEKAEQATRVCDHFGWKIIAGIESTEDLTDLKRALKEEFSPANVYDPCPCGSGAKYKFCCAPKMKNFDVNSYMKTFDPNNPQ
jgi:uncharacterized protein YecA (UPF0149 family)